MITSDMNLGSLVPVLLFLTAQTVGAVWWAASTHTVIENLVDEIQSQAARVELNTDRINAAATVAAGASAEANAMQREIRDLSAEISANNRLLRQLLREINNADN